MPQDWSVGRYPLGAGAETSAPIFMCVFTQSMPESIHVSPPENKITIRTATESDWPALQLLDSVGFGFHPSPAVSELTKALYKPEDIILAVDGDLPVGVAIEIDMEFTVPGGRQLPHARNHLGIRRPRLTVVVASYARCSLRFMPTSSRPEHRLPP